MSSSPDLPGHRRAVASSAWETDDSWFVTEVFNSGGPTAFDLAEEVATDFDDWLRDAESHRPVYVRCGRSVLRVFVPVARSARRPNGQARERASRGSAGRRRGSRRGHRSGSRSESSDDGPGEPEPPSRRLEQESAARRAALDDSDHRHQVPALGAQLAQRSGVVGGSERGVGLPWGRGR